MPLWARLVTWAAALRIAVALGMYLSGSAVTPENAPVPLGVYAALCAAFSFVGIALVLSNRSDVRAAWLGGVLLLLAVPLTSALLSRIPVDLVRPDIFAPAFLWFFVTEFPSRLGARTLTAARAAGVVCAAIAFVIAVANVSIMFEPLSEAGDWRRVVAIGARSPRSRYWMFFVVGAAAAFAALVARMIRSRGSDRFRSRVFVTGLLIGITPLLLQVLAEQSYPPFGQWSHSPNIEPWVASVLFGALATIPFMTAYSVLYDRIVETRIALQVAVQYALARWVVIVCTSVPFIALGIYLYERRTESLAELFGGSRAILLTAAVAGGAATVRTRYRLIRAVERRFFRESYDTHDLMASVLSDELLSQEPAKVAEGLASVVDATMHAAADLFVLDPRGAALIDPRNRRSQLAVDSMLVNLALADARPMDIDPRDGAMARLPLTERQWLEANGYRLLIALRSREGVPIGLIAFSSKLSGLAFSTSERQTIAAFAAPLAMAIDNERLRRNPASEEPPAIECQRCSRLLDRGADRCECGATTLVVGAAPRSLRGVYRLESRIGAGGMGVVYKGVDLSLRREVAIKTLPPTSDEHATKLRKEAHAMASLDHRHLAVIYGLETWRGIPFLIEEYLAGGTLADQLRARVLKIDEGLDLVIALADVLAHVHAQGIVHCDIKPSNIGFTQFGVVKLLDFGLAHLLRGPEHTLLTTITDAVAAQSATSVIVTDHGVMGTPPYMSPEAIHGARPIPSFDLWSLAVVLYEVLAGRRPFSGTTAGEVFQSIALGQFAPLHSLRPDCDPAISALVDRALARNLRDRPADAVTLRKELLHLRASVH